MPIAIRLNWGMPWPPGQYTVQLAGSNDKKARILSAQSWGPYNLPAGAIVDIELEL